MVATFAKLKLLILKNGFKRSPWQIVGVIIGLLYGLFIAGALIFSLVLLRMTEVELRGRVLILVGSFVILLWWLIPLITSKLDQTVDPKRLGQFPIRRTTFLLGTSVAGLIGIPGIFTSIVVLATIVTWSTGWMSAILAVLSVILVLAMTQVGARLFATFSELIITSRRGKEITGGIFLILLASMGPLGILLGNTIENMQADPETIIEVVDSTNAVLSWTPLGVMWAAPVDAASGNVLLGILKILLGIGYIVLLSWAWGAMSDRLLSNPPRESVKTEKQGGILDGFATDTQSSITVKTFRYWKRDSRLAVSNVMILVLPLIFVMLKFFAGDAFEIPDLLIASVGPMTAVLYGWGMHNMLAYDGTAFWAHIAASVKGRDDRLGRFYAEGLTGLVLITIVAFVGIGVSGYWDDWALILGVSYAVLLTFMGISTYTSTIWIYPVVKANQSPFSTPSGATMLTMLIQTVILMVGIVLLLPIIVFYILQFLGLQPEWVGYVIAVVGPVYGAVVSFIGIRLSGKRIDTHGPEILERLKQHTA